MTTWFRMPTIAFACLLPVAAVDAQLAPLPWVCKQEQSSLEELRLEYLKTILDGRLQTNIDNTGIAARKGYDKLPITLVQRHGEKPGVVASLCDSRPESCSSDKLARLCRMVPNECARRAKSAAFPDFETALQRARSAANAAIDRSRPLGTRNSLLTQLASVDLGQMPALLKGLVFEHALALELDDEAQARIALYEKNQIHRECAKQIENRYDDIVDDMPAASVLEQTVHAALTALQGFGLPGQDVDVHLLGDMSDRADFFEGFMTHVQAVRQVGTDVRTTAEAVRQPIIESDRYVRNHDALIEPAPGQHFTLMYLDSLLDGHRMSAGTAEEELEYLRTAINDAIELLRTELPGFTEGTAHSTGILPEVASIDEALRVYCEGASGRSANYTVVLDSTGHIGPWLAAHAGPQLRRDDAQHLLESTAICALRWAYKSTADFFIASFATGDSLEAETSSGAPLLQRLIAARAGYQADAQEANARAQQIDDATP